MNYISNIYDLAIVGIGYVMGGCLLGIALHYLYEKIILKNDPNPSKTSLKVFVAIGIILLLGYDVGIKQYWGSNTIGSFFEKDYYTTQYYVNLFADKNSSKNYRVKADILADFNENTDSRQRVYWAKRIYLNNGGYLTFNNEIEDSNDHASLVFNEKVQVDDDSGKEWYIELTDSKINK